MDNAMETGTTAAGAEAKGGERHNVIWAIPIIQTPTSQKMVIIERALDDKLYPGELNVVTGHIEAGQTYEETARREVSEELGVDREKITLKRLGEMVAEDGRLVFVGEVFAAFLDQSIAEDPMRYLRLSHEHRNMKIVPFENVGHFLQNTQLLKPDREAVTKYSPDIDAHMEERRSAMVLGRGINAPVPIVSEAATKLDVAPTLSKSVG